MIDRIRSWTWTQVVLAGLLAQVFGLAWQAAWRLPFASQVGDAQDRTVIMFLGDHVVSGLGVAVILVAALARLGRGRTSLLGDRVLALVAAGALLETIGVAGDLVGHLRGTEDSPIFYGLIGSGFLLVAASLLLGRERREAQ